MTKIELISQEDFLRLEKKIDTLIEMLNNTSNKTVDNWMSSEEVCDYIGITKITLQRWRDQSKITYYQIGRTIRYKKSDIDAFMENYAC